MTAFKEELQAAIQARREGRAPSVVAMGARYMMNRTQRMLLRAMGKDTALSEEERTRRLGVCKRCDLSSIEESGTIRCPLCGCSMQQKLKDNFIRCPHPEGSQWVREQGGMVSVIIPIYKETPAHVEKTIDSVLENARGLVEVIVVIDGQGDTPISREEVRVVRLHKNYGERYAVNRGAEVAAGEFLYRIDGHCNVVTKGWDSKLKEVCGDSSIVTCCLGAMVADTWELIPYHNYRLVSFNQDLEEKWDDPQHPVRKTMVCEDVYEQMCFTGCGWMIRADYYKELKGHDESLYPMGRIGPEWSLKVWLTGGEVLYHDGVICGHVFTEANPDGSYPFDKEKSVGFLQTSRALWDRWITSRQPGQRYSVDWLLGRFHPVPGWESVDRTRLPYEVRS